MKLIIPLRTSTPEYCRPLLDQLSNANDMGAVRKYGKKKALASSKAAAIFGESSTKDRKALGDITNALSSFKLDDASDESDIATQYSADSDIEIRFAHHGFRNTAATASVPRRFASHQRFGGDGAESIRSVSSEILQIATQLVIHEVSSENTKVGGEDNDGDETSKNASGDSDSDCKLISEDPLSLSPLFAAYREDFATPLEIHTWGEIIKEGFGHKFTKIAEASYAEVYRVVHPEGDISIVKVMRVKVAAEEGCQHYNNFSTARDTISELRIMNGLTEVPGFVGFKGAYIIKGKPCQPLLNAYDAYSERHGGFSEYPNPREYTENSTFLVIELADAGDVLEDIEISNINEVWDVLVGVTMALARAEIEFEFEHRDLHENNICYSRSSPSKNFIAASKNQKFGQSGISITIIDLGLSRAKLEKGGVIFNDMEKDMAVFGGPSNIQSQTYRLMRTYLLTGERQHQTYKWHKAHSLDGKSWDEFMPYTNVLWIRYLHDWLKKKMKKFPKMSNEFLMETKVFEKKLLPRSLTTDGSFSTAQEVLEYMVNEGWVSIDQAKEYGCDSSFMSS